MIPRGNIDPLETFDKHRKGGDAAFLRHLRNVLRDAYISFDLDSLQDYYERFVSAEEDAPTHRRDQVAAIQGALGFLIFTLAADRFGPDERNAPANDQEWKVLSKIANTMLSTKATIAFIRKEYQIAAHDTGEARASFHKTGTTSYILTVQAPTLQDDKQLVLKILKPRYLDIESIAASTEAYQTDCPNAPYVAKVINSGKSFVLMEFIEGKTLAEFVHSDLRRADDPDALILGIVTELCNHLQDLAERYHTVHGDLNPRNIIIRSVAPLSLCLIDFGRNYVLAERVGSMAQYDGASVYSAAETIDDRRLTAVGDVFSVGVMLIEMLTIDKFATRRFSKSELPTYLDRVRERSYGLASILEDMVEPNPRLRLFDMQFRGELPAQGQMYAQLRQFLEIEFELLALRPANYRLGKIELGFIYTLDAISFDFRSIPLGLVADSRALARMDARGAKWENPLRANSTRLGRWALAASTSHLVVVTAFLYFLRRHWLSGDLKTTWPAFVVCLSFSFVAVKYYLGIFGKLYVKDLGTLGRWTDRWMRWCALYWPPAILLVYAFGPKYWLIATWYGTLIVVVNNFLCHRLGLKAIQETSSPPYSDVPIKIRHELREFEEWWQQMLVYSFGMLLVGILILRGQLHDVWAFAGIFLVVNVFLWVYNCGRRAPRVGNMFQFLFQRYRRALAYQRLADSRRG